jgi:hypothetical protein
LLIAGIWAAHRSQKPSLAGTLLGLATAVKLFPAVLFLYFILRRQWKTALVGAGCFVGITLATAAVVGPETYSSYLRDVCPKIAEWRSVAHNNSLPALWYKLFDPGAKSEQIHPIVRYPAIAKIGALGCCAAILSLLTIVTIRGRSIASDDLAFGLTVTAMLLVSPVTWGHYFVILLLPLALIWSRLPTSRGVNGIFWGILIVLAVKPIHLWHLFGLWDWRTTPVTPWHSVTALSAQLYALLGLFALGASMAWQNNIQTDLLGTNDERVMRQAA